MKVFNPKARSRNDSGAAVGAAAGHAILRAGGAGTGLGSALQGGRLGLYHGAGDSMTAPGPEAEKGQDGRKRAPETGGGSPFSISSAPAAPAFAGPRSLREGQSGAILLIVLWALVAMSLLGLSFSGAIRTEVEAARNVVDQKQSYYLSRAGIEYAVFKILESRSSLFRPQPGRQGRNREIPPPLEGPLRLDFPEGSVTVRIIDEAGKINLNMVARSDELSNLIYNLLVMIGVEEHQADVITDSIYDWLDEDDTYRPNGAEDDYYLSLEEPYRAKNGLFDVPEELLLVQGVTPEIYYGRKGLNEKGEHADLYGLQNYLTTFTRSSQININSAPVAVLAAIPIIDYTTAIQIYNMREEAPIRDMTEVMERIPGLPTDIARFLSAQPSNVYTLVSEGQLNGSKVVSRIRCVVQVDGLGPKGYSVLYWNEADTEI
ncbi:MAG: general secretion pathway protein GspK [Acidobacteriota bacterium]